MLSAGLEVRRQGNKSKSVRQHLNAVDGVYLTVNGMAFQVTGSAIEKML